MKKIYDTNIIIDYPEVMLEDDVVLTYSILDELEHLKRKKRLNFKARKAVRNIMSRIDEIDIVDDTKLGIEATDDALLEVCLRRGYKLFTQDVLLYLRALNVLESVEYYEPVTDIYSGIEYYDLSCLLYTSPSPRD